MDGKWKCDHPRGWVMASMWHFKWLAKHFFLYPHHTWKCCIYSFPFFSFAPYNPKRGWWYSKSSIQHPFFVALCVQFFPSFSFIFLYTMAFYRLFTPSLQHSYRERKFMNRHTYITWEHNREKSGTKLPQCENSLVYGEENCKVYYYIDVEGCFCCCETNRNHQHVEFQPLLAVSTSKALENVSLE